MICRNCGRHISGDNPDEAVEGLACPHCGASLDDKHPHDPDSQDVPQRDDIDEDDVEADD